MKFEKKLRDLGESQNYMSLIKKLRVAAALLAHMLRTCLRCVYSLSFAFPFAFASVIGADNVIIDQISLREKERKRGKGEKEGKKDGIRGGRSKLFARSSKQNNFCGALALGGTHSYRSRGSENSK